MAKIGRNEPCPCGSGKKYKKCCLGSREADDLPLEPTAARAEPAPAGPLPEPPPWVVARWTGERNPNWPAAPDRVARMSTEEILGRLAALGIPVTRESFVDLARGRDRAWTVAEDWTEELDRSLAPADDWFTLVAAIELFKRWLPGEISIEILDERMQEGYRLDMAGDHAAACRVWLDLYDEIEPRIPPHVTDTTAPVPPEAFDGEQSIGNWLQDLSLALLNGAGEDAELAREGDRFFRRVTARFPDTPRPLLDGYRRDHAVVLAELDIDASVRLLEELLECDTRPGLTCSALISVLTFASPDRAERALMDRAIALLEEAITRPDVDVDEYDLVSGLEEIRQARKELDATP